MTLKMQRTPLLLRSETWMALAVTGAAVALALVVDWQPLNAQAAMAPHMARPGVQVQLELADPAALVTPPLPATSLPDVSGNPELRLLAGYRLLEQGRLAEALAVSRQLVHDVPQFRLGQLLHGDVLLAHQQALPEAFGGGAASLPDDIRDALRAEAQARQLAHAHKLPEQAVPAGLLQLPPSMRWVIVVETDSSRLHLFEQTATGLRRADHFYVTVGKQGVGKRVEGDQRTPLGLYFIQRHVPPVELDERLGAGALPLNYPNVLDRQLGRTGSAILLHGVPAHSYARAPQDSDGCVVMANDDLRRLSALLPERNTPVLITRRIQWRAPDTAPALPQGFAGPWQRWQALRQQGDEPALADFYRSPPGAQPGAPAVHAPLGGQPQAQDELSMMATEDDGGYTLVVTFRERGVALPVAGQMVRKDQIVRQYWRELPEGWRIVAEGTIR